MQITTWFKNYEISELVAMDLSPRLVLTVVTSSPLRWTRLDWTSDVLTAEVNPLLTNSEIFCSKVLSWFRSLSPLPVTSSDDTIREGGMFGCSPLDPKLETD